jgi:hypothetical protein
VSNFLACRADRMQSRPTSEAIGLLSLMCTALAMLRRELDPRLRASITDHASRWPSRGHLDCRLEYERRALM